MIDPFVLLELLTIGLVTGMAAGMLGIGGGIFFVPSLYFILPGIGVIPTEIAYSTIATSLFAGSFASTGAAIQHFRIKNLYINFALLLSAGSIITSLIFPKYVVDINPFVLKIIIAVTLIAVSINMFLSTGNSENKLKTLPKWILPIVGIFVGILSALSGLGGGVIFVPVLFYFFLKDIKLSIGTSSLAVALTMIVSAARFSLLDSNSVCFGQVGFINIYAGLVLGIGSLVGSYYGVKVFKITNTSIIRKIFSLFLLIISFIILVK